jgi:hypothetical protein
MTTPVVAGSPVVANAPAPVPSSAPSKVSVEPAAAAVTASTAAVAVAAPAPAAAASAPGIDCMHVVDSVEDDVGLLMKVVLSIYLSIYLYVISCIYTCVCMCVCCVCLCMYVCMCNLDYILSAIFWKVMLGPCSPSKRGSSVLLVHAADALQSDIRRNNPVKTRWRRGRPRTGLSTASAGRRSARRQGWAWGRAGWRWRTRWWQRRRGCRGCRCSDLKYFFLSFDLILDIISHSLLVL